MTLASRLFCLSVSSAVVVVLAAFTAASEVEVVISRELYCRLWPQCPPRAPLPPRFRPKRLAGANWCSASPAWWPPRTSSTRGRSSFPRSRRRTAGSAPRFRRPSASSWSCRRGARRLSAHFIDRYGPRVLVLFGGVLTGLAWVDQLVRDVAPRLLRRRGRRRPRRRRGLRHLHQQRDQVVSGQARPGGRPDRGRLRLRHDPHGHPDRQHDRERRLPGRVLHLRPDPGRGDLRSSPGSCARLGPARSSTRRRSRSRAATTRSARRCARRCSG